MHITFLELYDEIVSEYISQFFSEKLIMSRYINTQYEEKYLTFQRIF